MAESVLINGPFPGEEISNRLKMLGQKTDIGGHSVFIGQVRADESGGKKRFLKTIPMNGRRTRRPKPVLVLIFFAGFYSPEYALNCC